MARSKGRQVGLWIIMGLLFVGLGLGLAFVLNVCRALFLAWKASSIGLGAVDQWHDSAGFNIVIICFVFLWLLALLFKRKWATQISAINPHT